MHSKVEHLHKLRMIAHQHPRNSNLTSDLIETYKWLNAHASDSEYQHYLFASRGEQLFLNVDDPTIAWEFSSAAQLIFNGRDEGARRQVRKLLLPFRGLLLAAGAREIVDAVRPHLQTTPAEEELLALRTVFNQHRMKRWSTDVVIRSSDGEEFHAHKLILSAEMPRFGGQALGEELFRDHDASGGHLPGSTIRLILGTMLPCYLVLLRDLTVVQISSICGRFLLVMFSRKTSSTTRQSSCASCVALRDVTCLRCSE